MTAGVGETAFFTVGGGWLQDADSVSKDSTIIHELSLAGNWFKEFFSKYGISSAASSGELVHSVNELLFSRS
jgi:hypothetical protein